MTATETITHKEKYAAKEEARRHSAMHVAALILGIVSILGDFFWYISIPCGILAIIFGVKSARRLASKLGKAGLILGIIGISLTICIYMFLISFSILSF